MIVSNSEWLARQFETHRSHLRGVAYRMLGSLSDAEDAVQEAFLRAYRSRSSFRQDSSLWTWIYRILLNTCRDVGRRRTTRGEAPLDEPQLDRPAQSVDQPLRLTLKHALDELSPIYREVSEILDIPEGTSKGRLFEARQRLKAHLRGTTLTNART